VPKLRADYLIVGSGLTGASVARTLSDAGRDVLVLERRTHAGGNVRDAVHEPSGVRWHVHGPHYFRTNCERLWDWVRRFSPFRPWAARVQTEIDGRLYRWPLKTTDRHLWAEAVGGYNRKMWGVDAPAEALARVETRQDDDDERLKTDRFQGLPTFGYSAWVENMLAGVPVVTGFDYLRRRGEVKARRKLIFTGPVDEFYGFDLGRLAYRGQRRELTHHADACVPLQPVVQVNRPGPEVPHIREVEWNHLAASPSWRGGSLVTRETPYTPADPDGFEYPVNDAANAALRERYRARARAEGGVVFAGRLGRGIYLDMNEAVAAGLKLANRIIDEGDGACG
jgi:UDP-galactopyranose mutase